MGIRKRVAVAAAFACVALTGGARLTAAQAADPSKHITVPAADVKYAPIEVPGFPTGMKIAAIYGDPNATSGMYVIRLQFPAGYKFPAHWHPNAENLTVISGDLLLGMGDKEDAAKLVSYKPGTFMYIPGKMPHFGGVKGATIIQLHGEAPFKIELVKSTTKP
jgi:quercetin dioxygenase-like cupin family protein